LLLLPTSTEYYSPSYIVYVTIELHEEDVVSIIDNVIIFVEPSDMYAAPLVILAYTHNNSSYSWLYGELLETLSIPDAVDYDQLFFGVVPHPV